MTDEQTGTPSGDEPKAGSPAPEGAAASDAAASGAASGPVRRGPPVAIAEEVLNAAGAATARLLASVASPYAVESGGRDDLPWARMEPEYLVEVAQRCQEHDELDMELLHCLFAVDYVQHIQLVYILFSMEHDHKVMLKVDLPPDAPRIASVTDLWKAAGWYERETHDLFGVEFEGNPDLSPLLLYEGFEGHPGLKSYPLHEYDEF